MAKVINLFEAKAKKEAEEGGEINPCGEVASSFEEIMEQNRKNAERVKRERAEANRSVTRSYRLKD
jgi:hypothetical protein